MNGIRLRVGVDLVSIPELREMIETGGATFLDTCWTASEQQYCRGSTSRLAARWAAKEATMKALGKGLGDIDPLDIEVVSEEGRPPRLRLHGTARQRADEVDVLDLSVSLSHEASIAIAFVVAYETSNQQHD